MAIARETLLTSLTPVGNTVLFTVNASSNRYLLVAINSRNPSSQYTTGCVWKPDSGNAGADQAMTSLGVISNGTTHGFVELYGLLNPTSTVASSGIVVTWNTTAPRYVAAVALYSGVHQTTPVGSFYSNSGTSASATVDCSVTTASDVCFGSMNTENATVTPPTATSDAGQTELWNTATAAGSGGNTRSAGAEENGTGSLVNNAWTLSATVYWEAAVVALKQAAGGTTTPQTLSVTATATASTVRQTGLTRLLTSTAASTLLKRAGLTRLLTSAGTATAVAVRAMLRNLSVTGTATASTVRQAGLTRLLTSAAATTLLKQARMTRLLTSAGTATSVAARAMLRTLSVTTTAAPTMKRFTLKTIANTAAGTLHLARLASLGRTAVSTAASTLTKQTGKSLRRLISVTTGSPEFGAMMLAADATALTAMVAGMNSLGGRLYRPGALVAGSWIPTSWLSQVIDRAVAEGWRLCLVYRAYAPTSSRVLDPDLAAYQTTLRGILNRWGASVKLVVVENETDGATWTGSTDDYLHNYAECIKIATGEYGIPVSDSGYTAPTTILCTAKYLWDTYPASGHQRAVQLYRDYMVNQAITEAQVLTVLTTNAASIAAYDGVFRSMAGLGGGFVNFHWYRETHVNLVDLTEYLRVASGLPILSDEYGQWIDPASNGTALSLIVHDIQQLRAAGVTAAIYFNVDNTVQGSTAKWLTDMATGALLPMGDSWVAEVGASRPEMTANATSSVQSTPILTLIKLAGLKRLISASGAATVLKASLRNLIVTVAATPTVARVREFLSSLSVTAVATPIVSRLAAFLRSLSATSTAAPAVSRRAAFLRSLSATSTAAPTAAGLKVLLRNLIVTVAATPTVSRLAAFLRSLSATSTAAPAVSRRAAKTIVGYAGATPAVSRLAAFLRSLSVTTTAAPTAAALKVLLRNLIVTAVATPTLSSLRRFLRSLSVTGSGAATVSGLKAILRNLSVTITAAPTVSRLAAFLRSLSVTGSGAATVNVSRAMLRLVAVTLTGTTTLARSVRSSLLISISPQIALGRTIAHAVGQVTSTVTANLVKQAGAAASVVSTATASLRRDPALLADVTIRPDLSLSRRVSQSLKASAEGVATASRQVGLILQASTLAGVVLDSLRIAFALLRGSPLRTLKVPNEDRSTPVPPESRTDTV